MRGFGGVFTAALSDAMKRRYASSSLSFGGFAMSALLDEFEGFPRERDLIGRMLLAYGELEFWLVGCLREALTIVDDHTTARILFRVNGESPRLEVADAILRYTFAKHKLEAKWITAYAAVRHCKNIRNQYAHCHWQVHEGRLHFMDLDKEAKSKDEALNVTFYPINLALIEKQFQYFEYAAGYLAFLRDRLLRTTGKPPETPPFPEPKSISQPHLDSRPDRTFETRRRRAKEVPE